jgi:uncharacterized protein
MGKKEKEIKVVLDTNILISAIIFGGSISTIRKAWREARIDPILTRETFEELIDALDYPKFSLTSEQIAFLIQDEILPYFNVVAITEKVNGICTGPDDDIFISCALSADAGYIVTGDKALLYVKQYKDIKIISPADFIKILEKS